MKKRKEEKTEKKEEMHMLIVIVGESGSGKTTLAEELLKKGYRRITTATTRKRRRNEPEDAYHFVSREEFGRMQEAGELVESAVYNGNGYGTPASEIANALKTGRNVILLTPDGMRAVRNLAEKTGQRRGLIVAYLQVDRESRLKMLLATREDAQECLARVAGDETTFARMENEADVIIRNEGYEKSPETLAGELDRRSRVLSVIRVAPIGEGFMIRNGVSEERRHKREDRRKEQRQR